MPDADAVLVGPPDHVIAERQRLGLDHKDEVWDGEYHMVPAASDEHQRMVVELLVAWHPLSRAAGLHLRGESNLIAPEESGWREFRVPDLVVFSEAARAERGVVGAAALVVEVRSPGDESLAKLGYFERVGVGEVLIIDRDTKAVRHWVLDGARLVEQGPDASGSHRLRCLPTSLRTEAGVLVVDADGSVVRI